MADFHQEGIVTTLHGLYEAFDRLLYSVPEIYDDLLEAVEADNA